MKKYSARFKIFLISLGLGGFILTSCGPDDKPTAFLSQETKDYCLFQKGSYWVYESEFGEIDSISAYRRDDYIGELENKLKETFGMRLNSSYETKDTLRLGMGPFTDGGGHVSEYWDDHYLQSYTVFFHFLQDTPGMEYKQPGKLILFDAFSDSTAIKGKIFYKIKSFKTMYTSNRFAIKQVWWAKHIGKIKYIDRNDVEWSLIRYSVSQT